MAASSSLHSQAWGMCRHVPTRSPGQVIDIRRGQIEAFGAGLILLARRSWLRQSACPVPEAEYLVAVWAISYIALVAIVASGRAINLADAFIISPPLGILPLALRVMLGDDGHPAGRARTAAHRLHLVLGWLHIAAGVLAVITVFYVFVAPLQLIPGAFHLRASYRYGVRRSEPA